MADDDDLKLVKNPVFAKELPDPAIYEYRNGFPVLNRDGKPRKKRGGARPNSNKMGRPKGGRNQKTIQAIETLKLRGKELPLEYMVRVMNDSTASQERRDQMAMSAAPYFHPKLTAIRASIENAKGDELDVLMLAAQTQRPVIEGTSVELFEPVAPLPMPGTKTEN